MADNTLSLHRILRASPEQVYRAFTEPDAIAFWLPPYGYTCTVEQMDVRVGGHYRMCFTHFTSGQLHPFWGDYLELIPHLFIKHTDIFDFPEHTEMVTSIWITEVSVGTALKIIQEGLPSFMPPEMCTVGWQQSLEKLAKLVEPKIPLPGQG